MSSSFDKSLTEFTYLIERISIVTKEFLNKLNTSDKLYNLIHEIYKSTQSINYEFIKLCYNIRSDKTININIPNINDINIPIEGVKDVYEYRRFIEDCRNTLKESLKIIRISSEKYYSPLNKELNNFEILIDKINVNKKS